MTEKPKVLTDPRIIRSFIMYEAGLKSSVINGYENFCKVLGDDVMSFCDYDYWYHRFYNGNLDINHDRSSDPPKPTFDQLPVEMFAEIMSKLDVKNRVTSRATCRRMAQASRITSKTFKKVGIKVEIYNIELKLDAETTIYEKWGDGCAIKKSQYGKEKTMGDNYLQKAMDDLKLVLAGPRIDIKTFSMTIGNHRGSEEVLRLLHDICDEATGRVFRVENAEIQSHNFETGFSVLARMQPEVLKKIDFRLFADAKAINISELQSLEQFKKAKEIDIKFLGVIDACVIFNNFKHFEVFQITAHSITVEQIVLLRDMLLLAPRCAKFKKCTIDVGEWLDSKHDAIQEALEGPREVRNRLRGIVKCYLEIPHSNGACMEFKIESHSITVTRLAQKPDVQESWNEDELIRRYMNNTIQREWRRQRRRSRERSVEMSENPGFPTDPRTIRSFILYEAMLKTNVFEGYAKFCQVNGDNVMNFVDYEYWYYRFYNGYKDMNHERSLDPPKPMFVELPVEMIAEILSKLDVKDRLISRRVSKIVSKAYGQTSKKFEEVSVEQELNRVKLKFDEENVIYQQADDGCIIEERGGKEIPMSGNYLKEAMENLKLVLEGPKIEIKTFSVSNGRHDGWEDLFGMLQKIGGESKSGVLRVEQAQVTVKDYESGLQLLARMKPQKLEKIQMKLCNSFEARNISGMQVMEQFKKAKEIDIRSFVVIESCLIFNHFKHFEVFQIRVHSVTVEQMQQLRDMLLLFPASPNFKNCKIDVEESLESKYDAIRNILKETDEDEISGRNDIYCLRRIPHSNGAYMVFQVRFYAIIVTRHAQKSSAQMQWRELEQNHAREDERRARIARLAHERRGEPDMHAHRRARALRQRNLREERRWDPEDNNRRVMNIQARDAFNWERNFD